MDDFWVVIDDENFFVESVESFQEWNPHFGVSDEDDVVFVRGENFGLVQFVAFFFYEIEEGGEDAEDSFRVKHEVG